MSDQQPGQLAVTRHINEMVTVGHTVFALSSDNKIFYSDDYTQGWTQLMSVPAGTISCITCGVWPGPSADIFLFVATASALNRYDRDSDSWTAMPYLP
jgi:hypothetical protein